MIERRHGEGMPIMTALQNRNVTLADRRTSLRLEPAMWDALEEVARRENRSLHEVCTWVESQRDALSLTAAVRVFILAYFRAAATEAGHKAAGHGKLRLPDRRMIAAAAAAHRTPLH